MVMMDKQDAQEMAMKIAYRKGHNDGWSECFKHYSFKMHRNNKPVNMAHEINSRDAEIESLRSELRGCRASREEIIKEADELREHNEQLKKRDVINSDRCRSYAEECERLKADNEYLKYQR